MGFRRRKTKPNANSTDSFENHFGATGVCPCHRIAISLPCCWDAQMVAHLILEFSAFSPHLLEACVHAWGSFHYGLGNLVPLLASVVNQGIFFSLALLKVRKEPLRQSTCTKISWDASVKTADSWRASAWKTQGCGWELAFQLCSYRSLGLRNYHDFIPHVWTLLW